MYLKLRYVHVIDGVGAHALIEGQCVHIFRVQLIAQSLSEADGQSRRKVLQQTVHDRRGNRNETQVNYALRRVIKYDQY